MRFQYLNFLLPALLPVALADLPSHGIVITECKTCPYTLCPNKSWYSQESNVTLTCWTEGTPIVNDTTWLKTTDGCYVTQYDLIEYAGDYTEDLPYCGRIRPNYTTVDARTKYFSDCYMGTSIGEYDIKHYKYEIDLTLTCVAPSGGSEVLGLKKWYKTTSNCYVHETTLYRVRGEAGLDDCGPVPNVDPYAHDPDPATSSAAAAAPTPAPTPGLHDFRTVTAGKNLHGLQRRFLYNSTAGEEYVNCTANASQTPSRVKRVYDFGQEIVLQCGTYGDSGANIIYLFTTDFCYVRDEDTDPGLLESTLRSNYFPHCEAFTDTE